MKKIMIFVLLLAMSAGLMAQRMAGKKEESKFTLRDRLEFQSNRMTKEDKIYYFLDSAMITGQVLSKDEVEEPLPNPNQSKSESSVETFENRAYFTYDSRGNCIKEENKSDDEKEDYINLYQYDSKNRLTLEEYISGIYKNKIEYIYNGDKLSEVKKYYKSSLDTNYILNNIDRYSNDTVHTYSTMYTNLENYEELYTGFTVKEQEGDVEIESNYWSEEDGFTLGSYTEYTYNSGKLIKEQYFTSVKKKSLEDIYKEAEGFTFGYKTEYSYEGENLKEIVSYETDETNPRMKVEMFYDGTPIEDVIMSKYFFFGDTRIWITSRIDKALMYDYNIDSNGFVKSGEMRPFYNKRTLTGLNNPQPKTFNLSIYPNPTNEKIFIGNDTQSSVKFELYDVQGKKILSNEFNGSTILNVSNLTQGAYIYRAIEGNKISNGKIIKR